jgi:UDP-N-acetylglucosamine acyltransferase
MAVSIHPTAQVDPTAKLADGVEVGPYAVIGPEVTLGEGCSVGPHAVLVRNVVAGKRNRIHAHAVVGGDPQDLKYKGERSWIELGDDNTIREFTTLNRGTGEDGRTVIGSHNLFMAYTHVGHDCRVGNHIVQANCVPLAGHVTVEDHVVIGGLAGVHQHARIGEYAMVGGGCGVSKDVCPYVIISGDIPQVFGLNLIGLRRAGFTKESLAQLDAAYKTVFRGKLNTSQAVEALEAMPEQAGQVKHLIAFIKASQRGIHK